jgi:hypothetical protein
MNQNCFIKIVLCVSFFLPVICEGQTISRVLNVRARESLSGEPTELTAQTNSSSAGSFRGLDRTLSSSGSYGRASIVADAFALRLSGKASSHAGLFNGAGPTLGEANASAVLQDSVIISSPSIPDGAHYSGTARIRVLISSSRTVPSPEGGFGGTVSITLYHFQTGFIFWSTNSTTNAPNGEFLIDMPATVDGLNPPYQLNTVFLTAEASSGAIGGSQGGGPAFSSSASASFTVTWGGIVSLKLDDNTVISDFQVTGVTGASYRNQRTRTDQSASISKPSSSNIALQWAGTTNIFYQVESASSLLAGDWSAMGDAVEGSGTNLLTDSIQQVGSRFYRVIDAPLP